MPFEEPETQRETEIAALNLIMRYQNRQLLDLDESVFNNEMRTFFRIIREGFSSTVGFYAKEMIQAKLQEQDVHPSLFDEIAAANVSPFAANQYLELLIDSTKKRVMTDLVRYVHEGRGTPEDLLQRSINHIERIEKGRVATIKGSLLTDEIARYREMFFTAPVSTGLPTVDRLLGGGLRREEMTVLGAPPGSAKSALSGLIAYNIAKSAQHRTVFFSKEMRNSRIISRLLAHVSKLPVGSWETYRAYINEPKKHKLTDTQIRDLHDGLTIIDNAAGPYFGMFDLEDSPIINPEVIESELHARNAQLAAEGHEPIFLAVIDYLHILDFEEKSASMVHVLNRMSAQLHDIALREGCHILLLSATNRANQYSLTMDAIRDAGGINNNTDNTLLMLKLKDLDCSSIGNDWAKENQPLIMRADKVRNGQDGKEDFLGFSGQHQTVYELEGLKNQISSLYNGEDQRAEGHRGRSRITE